MPDPPVLPPRLDAALERVLEPGETVVWAGAPERWPNPAAVLLRSLVAAALLATGAAWFVGFVPGVVSGWIVTSAMALVASAGTAWTFAEARRQSGTRYVITDRRPLVLRPTTDEVDVDEVPAWSLGTRRKDVRYTGRGTITFPASTGEHDLSFRHMADVRVADAALARLPGASPGSAVPLDRAAPQDASLVPSAVVQALAGVLQDGETIRWWGHPDPAAFANVARNTRRRASRRSLDTLALVFALMMGAYAALLVGAAANGAFKPESLSSLVSPLLVLSGLLVARFKMRRRLYVITDRKALIVRPAGWKRFEATLLSPEALAHRRRVKNASGLASLRFDGQDGPPRSYREAAFVGPQPLPVVERFLDALAPPPEPSRPHEIATARASGVPLPEPLPGVPLDAPPPSDAPVLHIPRTRA